MYACTERVVGVLITPSLIWLGMKLFDLVSEQNVFFFGDMNYRIEIPREVTVKMASQSKWRELADQDQLSIEMAHGRVLNGFLEGKLDFPPTYKYGCFPLKVCS